MAKHITRKVNQSGMFRNKTECFFVMAPVFLFGVAMWYVMLFSVRLFF